MADEFGEYRGLEFMESRIPAIDALSTFVADDAPPGLAVRQEMEHRGQSRWFPVPGGHRVLVPYEGGAYDASHSKIESGAWDHETCRHCRVHIPAMTLCWVTRSGWYVTLCTECVAKMRAAQQ
jgi:hypothetical protein